MIRWTPLIYAYPKAFIENSIRMKQLSLTRWSLTYRYKTDLKYRDTAKEPWQTVMDESGDCEDYALVAASCSYSKERSVVGIAYVRKRGRFPSHVIAYDDQNVYSSGTIYRSKTVDEYLKISEYDYAIKRRLR